MHVLNHSSTQLALRLAAGAVALAAAARSQAPDVAALVPGESPIALPSHPSPGAPLKRSAFRIEATEERWVLLLTQAFLPTEAPAHTIAETPVSTTATFTAAELRSALANVGYSSPAIQIEVAPSVAPPGVTTGVNPALFVAPERVAQVIDECVRIGPETRGQWMAEPSAHVWQLTSNSWSAARNRGWKILSSPSSSAPLVPYMSMPGLLEKTLYEQLDATSAKTFIKSPSYFEAIKQGLYVAVQAITVYSPSTTGSGLPGLGLGADLVVSVGPVMASGNMESPPPDSAPRIDVHADPAAAAIGTLRGASLLVDIVGGTGDMWALFSPGLGEPTSVFPIAATHEGYGLVQLTLPIETPPGACRIRVGNGTGASVVIDHVTVLE